MQWAARKAKEIEVGGKLMQIDALADATLPQIAPSYDAEGNVTNVVNFKKGETIGEYNRSVVSMRAFLKGLFKSDAEYYASSIADLFNQVIGAEGVVNVSKSDIQARISQLVKKAVKNDKGMKGILNPLINRVAYYAPFIDSRSEYAKPIFLPDIKKGGFTFKNKGELYMALLLTGSESGAHKFLRGYDLGDFDFEQGTLDESKWWNAVQGLIDQGTLTQEDFDLLQGIWDIMEEIHPLVKTSLRKSDGWEMGHIAPRAFTVKLNGQAVTIRGGYAPIGPRDLQNNQLTDKILSQDTMGYRPSDLYPQQNTGNSKIRTEAIYQVNLDMGRLNAYISAALNIAHLRNPLLDFGKLLEHPAIYEAIEARRPGAMGEWTKNGPGGVVATWFDAVKSQEYTEFSTELTQKIAKKLRENLNMIMYLANPFTPAKQYLGLGPVAAKVGAVRTALAAARVAARRGMIMEQAKKDHPGMANRLDSSARQMIKSWDELDYNFDWITWTDEKKTWLTYFLIQLNQNNVDLIAYEAAKDHAADLGLTGQAAINYAYDVVNTTQSSPDVSSMVNVQRGKDSWKLITSVTHVPLAMHSMVRENTMRDIPLDTKAKTVLVLALGAWIAPNLLDAIMGAAFEEEKEEDKRLTEEQRQEKTATTIALRTALGGIDYAVPFYSRAVTSAIGYGSPSVAPFFSKLQKLPAAGKAGQNLADGVDLNTREAVALLEMFSLSTGIPLHVLGKASTLDEYLKDDKTKRQEKRQRTRQKMRVRMAERQR
jgi:hypothetical protein